MKRISYDVVIVGVSVIGSAMIDLVVTGRYHNLDLGRLGYERAIRNEPPREANMV